MSSERGTYPLPAFSLSRATSESGRYIDMRDSIPASSASIASLAAWAFFP